MAIFGGSLEKAVREGWVEPFQKLTGARVILDSPTSKAKLKAQVDSGNTVWDVFTEDAAYVALHCGTLFEKVNTSKFVAAGIDKRFVNNECGVPGAVVGFVFAYDEGKYGAHPPRSWADFFDLKRFPGKRAMHNNVVNGALEMALLADGVPADKLYPLDLDRAFRKLDTIKGSIVWTQSSGGLTDALVNDQVDLALAYHTRAYAAAKAGAPVAVVPDQWILSWDQYAVVKGTKNHAAAEAYLNFIAQPEQQAKMTETRSSGNSNALAKPQLDALTARFVPSKDKGILQDMEWWAKNYDVASQRFVNWQSR